MKLRQDAIFSTLIFLVLLISCKQTNENKSSDTMKGDKKISKQAMLHDTSLIKQILMNGVSYAASDTACGKASISPKLNVWEYIINMTGINYKPGDQWFLHKGQDANGVICFILAVEPSDGSSPSYYRGTVDCPNICGFTNGCLPADALQGAVPVRSINERDAKTFLSNQVPGLIYTIRIDSDGVNDLCNKHAAYINAVMGNVEPNSFPNQVLVFGIDANGNVIGDAWSIKDGNDFCQATLRSSCELYW